MTVDVEREENLEYTRGDVPGDQECGHYYPKWGRVCRLRKGHQSARHRECEISWTNEMTITTKETP
jgi:hypothetical protein